MGSLEIFHLDRHGEPGAGAEGVMRVALREAFGRNEQRDGALYEQYPVWHKQALRTPDLLLLSAELGLVNVEVKGLYAEQLVAMHGDCWEVRNYFDSQTISPFEQAQSALDLLLKTAPRDLPGIARRILVALPFIPRDRCARATGTSDRILWKEDIEDPDRLWERLRTAPAQNTSASVLDGAAWQGWKNFLSRRTREIRDPAGSPRPTKREIIDEHLIPFERKRETELRGQSLELPMGVLRLRGIAGSGKTVLLTQLAAWMHDCFPRFRIGLVFHIYPAERRFASTGPRTVPPVRGGGEREASKKGRGEVSFAIVPAGFSKVRAVGRMMPRWF